MLVVMMLVRVVVIVVMFVVVVMMVVFVIVTMFMMMAVIVAVFVMVMIVIVLVAVFMMVGMNRLFTAHLYPERNGPDNHNGHQQPGAHHHEIVKPTCQDLELREQFASPHEEGQPADQSGGRNAA
jgi:hypothetical protein